MPVLCLGKVSVAAAGTPVQLYHGQPAVRGNTILVQALPGNTGNIYVGNAGLNKGTLASCAAVLIPGASATLPAGSPGNPLNPEGLYVDADDAGAAVLVTVVVA